MPEPESSFSVLCSCPGDLPYVVLSVLAVGGRSLIFCIFIVVVKAVRGAFTLIISTELDPSRQHFRLITTYHRCDS